MILSTARGLASAVLFPAQVPFPHFELLPLLVVDRNLSGFFEAKRKCSGVKVIIYQQWRTQEKISGGGGVPMLWPAS